MEHAVIGVYEEHAVVERWCNRSTGTKHDREVWNTLEFFVKKKYRATFRDRPQYRDLCYIAIIRSFERDYVHVFFAVIVCRLTCVSIVQLDFLFILHPEQKLR